MADEVKEEKIDSPEASEEVKEEVKEEKPKGMLGKLGDAIVPDHDEQLAIISTFVRLGILVWSGGILTLNYVAIPNFPQKNIDPTFIASVLLEFWLHLGFRQLRISRMVMVENPLHLLYLKQIWRS